MNARFTGPKEVTVRTAAGDVVVTARHIVVGTGTVPARLDVPGADLPGVYDSTTIQHADPFPGRLAVIGGGYVGLEFASMFQQFGSAVTLLEAGPALLRREEPVVAETAVDLLTRRGVTIRTDAAVSAIERSDGGLLVAIAEMALAGGLGAEVEGHENYTQAQWWFGEDQGRYVVTVPDVDAFQHQIAKGTRDADTASSGLRRIGTVGGDSLFGVPLAKLRDAHESFFEEWMEA